MVAFETLVSLCEPYHKGSGASKRTAPKHDDFLAQKIDSKKGENSLENMQCLSGVFVTQILKPW